MLDSTTTPTSFLSLTIQSNNNNANNSNNNPNINSTQNTTNPNSANHQNPLTFNITKAYIKESLASLFEIHCEGYIENLASHPFSEFNTNNNPSLSYYANNHINHNRPNPNNNNLNFHPNALIDSNAIFSILNPYPNSNTLNSTLSFANTLDSNKLHSHKLDSNDLESNNLRSNNPKFYTGIISNVQYLGLNSQSTDNILNRANISHSPNHKHFFNFSITSPLFRASLNKAYRIYTNKTPIEAIKATLRFYENILHKNLDFSNISFPYAKAELITQYNESDLNFIFRIAHNNGIYFYEDADTIYFYDFMTNRINIQESNPDSNKSSESNNAQIQTILFNPNINNTQNIPCINSLYKSQSLFTKSFTQSTHSALNPYELHSLSNTFNANLNNYDESNNMQDLSDSNNINNNDLIYHSHIYNSQYSFSHSSNLNTPLDIALNRANMIHNIFSAQSNIYDLHLNQSFRIHLEHSTSSKQQNLQDFYIIENKQILINQSLLDNNFNTNDNIAKKSNAFFNSVLSNNQTHLQNPFTQANPNQNNTNQINILDSSQSLDSLTSHITNPTKSQPYSNALILLPINISFTPNPKAKPLSPTTTLGIVIGERNDITKELNTIHTDSFGRVRVRINCFANQAILDSKLLESTKQNNQNNNIKDLGESNESTNFKDSTQYYYSPYLRIASPIASNNSGFYHTPRVGDEVLISFLDNDIDKPYISGSLYNESNKPNLNLPIDSHKTTLSAKTIGTNENGINEITLNNLKDSELISIHAQKDYNEIIEHNFTQTILNNKDSHTQGNYNEHINKIHTQTIDLAKIVKVGAEYNTNVALSKHTIVGTSNTLNVGLDNKLHITQNSSEFVGGDKEVIINGSVEEKITQDKYESVKGHLSIKSDEEINILSKSQLNLNANANMLLTSNQSISMDMQEYFITQAKNAIMQVLETLEIQSKILNIDSQDNITLKIGESNIIIAKDNVITISVDGNEITLNSDGVSINAKKTTIAKGN